MFDYHLCDLLYLWCIQVIPIDWSIYTLKSEEKEEQLPPANNQELQCNLLICRWCTQHSIKFNMDCIPCTQCLWRNGRHQWLTTILRLFQYKLSFRLITHQQHYVINKKQVCDSQTLNWAISQICRYKVWHPIVSETCLHSDSPCIFCRLCIDYDGLGHFRSSNAYRATN